MKVVSEATGKKASLIVKKSYALQKKATKAKEVAKDRTSSVPVDPMLLQDENQNDFDGTTAGQGENGSRLQELDNFADWAADAIRDQKKDIDRLSTVVGKIERDMQTFKEFMTSIRKELASKYTSSEFGRVSDDVVYLQNDVDNLRLEIQNVKESRTPQPQGLNVPAEELDVMTESISMLSSKVNEVETLKLEIQFMKSRIKRMEEGTRGVAPSVEPRSAGTPGPVLRIDPGRSASAAPSTQQASFRKPFLPLSSPMRASVGSEAAAQKRKSFPGADARPSFKKGRLSDAAVNTVNRRPSQLSQVHLAEDIDNEPEGDSDFDLTYISDSEEEFEAAIGAATSRKPRNPPSAVSSKASVNTGDIPDKPQRKRGPPKGRPSNVNAEGVKVTKSGVPDKRVGNIKNIRKWQDKVRQTEERDMGPRKEETVVQSVEGNNNVSPDLVHEESDEARQAALEARERLVRETIEREL